MGESLAQRKLVLEPYMCVARACRTRPDAAVLQYNQTIYNLRGISVSPARIESTCHMLVFGTDIFYSRVSLSPPGAQLPISPADCTIPSLLSRRVLNEVFHSGRGPVQGKCRMIDFLASTGDAKQGV